ncbi:DUF4870 domain-containing protein [Sporosarcina sp. 6E9]|uniref:DUF4870 domain-containing protein n=1 Tax=Sporosarcina sp. 6E9 TaxID=2819235 RepID=UPI001B316604|nr:DUF4870 domain-containing protein [Sporosarcina sp. 6E9]
MEHTGMKVLIHASAFFAPFLVPILMFLISEDHEIKKLSIQAVLFQLVIGLLITISAFMSIFLIGIPFVIGFGVMWIVVPIIGIAKALQNEGYDYPIVGRWVQ